MQLQRCLVPMVRCRLTAILPQKSGSVQCCCLRPLENCDKGAVKSNNKSPKKSFHGWMCLERSSNTSRSPVLYTLQWGAQIICKVKYKISHDDCNPFLHPIYSSSNKIWHYYVFQFAIRQKKVVNEGRIAHGTILNLWYRILFSA